MKKNKTLNESKTDQTANKKGVISTDLLCCAECGASAKSFCVMSSFKHEKGNKKSAIAECQKCFYKVTITTSKDVKYIRNLWNMRIA